MKLFLINEVFDRPSVEGVKIKESSSGSIIYTFKDEINSDTYEYIIDIIAKTRLRILEEIDVIEEFKIKHPNAKNSAVIYMEVSKNGGKTSFNETGLGNQWFVYGKLIACVNHFVVKNKPITLEFGGATDSMDLVYDRFVKMSKKHYPQDAYVYYLGDIYVRKDILDGMSETYDMTVAKERRKKQLDHMRQRKNYMRASKKSESNDIDESTFFESMNEFQINEVFDRPSMDGVDFSDHGTGTVKFTFRDKPHDMIYHVNIYSIDDIRNTLPSMSDIHELSFVSFKDSHNLEHVGCSIYMSSASETDPSRDSYDVTGIGNQWLVYGKLIACVNYYVTKYKPMLLYFSGANDNMDLVYDRFIKMSQKLYPKDAYVPYINNTYARKEIFDTLEDDESTESKLTRRDSRLKDIKRYKNSQRSHDMVESVNSRISKLEQYQINEVFDRPSMDGVKIDDSGRGTISYEFKDENIGKRYIVKIYGKDIDDALMFSSVLGDDSDMQSLDKYSVFLNDIKRQYPKSMGTAIIYLSSIDSDGNESFRLTKSGNQWLVYSKLIACLNDYMNKYKPITLKFSGATNNMDLVYDRFIKMSKKTYPEHSYVPLSDEIYIRKEMFEMIEDEKIIQSNLASREARLKDIRKSKNTFRKHTVRESLNSMISKLEQYQIDEVFDKPNMDGVTIGGGHKLGSTNYYFKDEDNFMVYEVEIYNIGDLDYIIPNLPEEHESVLKEFLRKNNQKTPVGSIYLTAASANDEASETYEPTGVGNQWFVYGKLIACVNDFVTKYKPSILTFSGSTEDMNLVYDRFVKMSQRHYPQDAYVPYLGDTYIRKDIYDNLPRDERLEDDLYVRNHSLSMIRKNKNEERKKKLLDL